MNERRCGDCEGGERKKSSTLRNVPGCFCTFSDADECDLDLWLEAHGATKILSRDAIAREVGVGNGDNKVLVAVELGYCCGGLLDGLD